MLADGTAGQKATFVRCLRETGTVGSAPRLENSRLLLETGQLRSGTVTTLQIRQKQINSDYCQQLPRTCVTTAGIKPTESIHKLRPAHHSAGHAYEQTGADRPEPKPLRIGWTGWLETALTRLSPKSSCAAAYNCTQPLTTLFAAPSPQLVKLLTAAT